VLILGRRYVFSRETSSCRVFPFVVRADFPFGYPVAYFIVSLAATSRGEKILRHSPRDFPGKF